MKKSLCINFEGKAYNVEVEIVESRESYMTGVRTDNIRAFRAFRKWYGKRVYKSFFSSKRAAIFNYIYKENITDQTVMGVLNERNFAVSWGARHYDSELRFIDAKRNLTAPYTVLLAENGAQLVYTLMDDGRVCVCLYRAETDRNRKDNDYILVDEISNPRKLLNKKTLKRHWNKLLTCMENTCIESKPNLASRIRMFWLNVNYPYTEKDRMNVRRIYSESKKLFLYMLPILFSGFGLTFFPYIYQKFNPSPIERETENQKELVETLKNIEQKTVSIEESLKQNAIMTKKIMAEYDSNSAELNKFVVNNDSVVIELIGQTKKIIASELNELKQLRKELKNR